MSCTDPVVDITRRAGPPSGATNSAAAPLTLATTASECPSRDQASSDALPTSAPVSFTMDRLHTRASSAITTERADCPCVAGPIHATRCPSGDSATCVNG